MRKIIFSSFLFCCIMKASAQALSDSSATFKLQVADSVIAKKKNGWIKSAIAAGYVGATYLCYRYLDTHIQEESQEGKTDFKTSVSNTITELGLGKVQAIGWGGTVVVAFATRNKKLQRTVIIWAGGLLINSVVTDQLKLSFQRHRPNTGDAYNVFDWRGGPGSNTSLPSAHTSNAFTTATVFATLYKNNKWVPPLAYSLATLVAFTRIYNNAHWASDVLAGAAVGFLSAKASIRLYNWASKKLLFLPQPGPVYSSVAIVYRF